jgi:hypothetical protein
MAYDIADICYRRYLETGSRSDAMLALDAIRVGAPYMHPRVTPVLEGDEEGKVTVEIVHAQRRLPAPNGHGSNGSNGHSLRSDRCTLWR